MLLAVFVVVWLGVVFVQVSTAANDAQNATAEGDAIVVLGAAQYNGEPSPVLERRLDTAFSLWSDGAADQIVTTGANQPGDTFTEGFAAFTYFCLLYTSPSPRDKRQSRMPSSA